MGTHNIHFYGEMWKIIPKLSWNTRLICSTVSDLDDNLTPAVMNELEKQKIFPLRKVKIFTILIQLIDFAYTASYIFSMHPWLHMFVHQTFELPHDKTNKMACVPREDSDQPLGICPVWSESSLSAWRNIGSLPTQWVDSEDCVQTGQMPRLLWVFARHTVILLVLSWGGSFAAAKVCCTQKNKHFDWKSRVHLYLQIIAYRIWLLQRFIVLTLECFYFQTL